MGHKRQRVSILCLLCSFFVFLTIPAPQNAFAGPLNNSALYKNNNILFYNPNECADDGSGDDDSNNTTGSSGVTSSSSLSQEQIDFVVANHDRAEALSIQYGIPWETVVAQGILESASGTSQLAKDKNNFFGIGAYDGCAYTCAFSYSTPEEGWEGYYKNIVKTSTYRNHGVFKDDAITDPHIYLERIKAAGYATDPDYVQDVGAIVSAIETLSQEQNWLSSAELAKKHPEMIKNANENAKGANPTSSSSSSSSSSKRDEKCPKKKADHQDLDPSTMVFYDQCDSKWSSTKYGGAGDTCSSGCGPTSFAVIASNLLHKSITPDETTKIAGDKGMHVQIDGEWKGSSHQITKVLGDEYGLKVEAISGDVKTINSYLEKGAMIHTSGAGSKPFTQNGHYIAIVAKLSNGKWLVADSSRNGPKAEYEPEDVIKAGMDTGNVWAVSVK